VTDVQAVRQVRNKAELAVLETMRQPNSPRFTVVQTSDEEVLLEIYEDVLGGGTVQKDQIPPTHQETDSATPVSRKIVKKVSKDAIGIVAVKMKD